MAVATRQLTKSFTVGRRHEGRFAAIRSFFDPLHEKRTVVKDVTMEIQRGELVGLLGPNGAGKSTCIKMMTGILTPTSGDVLVNGRVPYRDRINNARSIGVVFGQKTQLWWDLPARQSFGLLADIYDIPPSVYRQRLAEFDSILGLSEFWDTPVRNLSLGQRVRSDLAAAMLHDPPIVFLDEPTIGMDVVVKEQTREFLRAQVRRRGRTVLLTTHDMEEVSRLCERVVLINHGQLMFDGTLSELKARHGGSPLVSATLAGPALSPVTVPGARVVSNAGTLVTLEPLSPATPEDVVRAVISAYTVVNIGVTETNIEDLIRHVYLAAEEDSSANAAAKLLRQTS